MGSINDIMNEVIWHFLEILFAQLLTWNINLHKSYKVEDWMLQIWLKDSEQFTDQNTF